jgi:GNAT superfamily N-acetyltransferase
MAIEIREVDPQGSEAMGLLHEAALDARALYPELHDPAAPGPRNPPTPPGGTYLLAYLDGVPLASGALRPLDEQTAEVRRMYVLRTARRGGLARAMLVALEARARALGYRRLRLETGCRQQPAMALYEASGFRRIPPFGPYVDDPTSVCFEKVLSDGPGDTAATLATPDPR